MVNALSRWVTVEVFTQNRSYKQEFESAEGEDGKIVSGRPKYPLTETGRTRKQGSLITFMPDDRVFETVEWNYDVIMRRLRELAYLNRGVKLTLEDQRPGKKGRQDEFCFEGGLSDFVRYLNSESTPLYDTPIHIGGKSGDILVDLAIQHNDGYNENLFSYVNNIPTSEGGTHETGFKAAFTKCMNDYCRRTGILKDKDPSLAGEDFREGLTVVLSVKMRNIQFEGQTKTKLGNTEARPAVEAVVTQELSKYLEDIKNAATGNIIADKAIKASKARQAARKAKEKRGRPPARPRRTPGRRTSWRTRPWSGSFRAAPAGTTPSTSSSSWRATPPAVRRSRAGTGGSRPSCPFAASR